MTERRFNPAHMAKLDNPERKKLIAPEASLAKLNIGDQSDVLDLGAGLGFFAIPAATQTSGTVYALDVAKEMLHELQARAAKASLDNVAYIQGEIEQIPLDDEQVDHIIASMVLHEVEPLEQGLAEIKRVLKPGGTVLCVEWEKVETEQGPPLNHRIHSKDMKKAVEGSGFKRIDITHPSEAVYVMTFQK